MPENVIVGGKSTTRHTHEMEAMDAQIFHQRVKVLRDGAGLRPSARNRGAAPPSAPIESDGAISGLDEGRNVVLKAVGIAGLGVKRHDRNTVAAAIRVYQRRTPGSSAWPANWAADFMIRSYDSVTVLFDRG